MFTSIRKRYIALNCIFIFSLTILSFDLLRIRDSAASDLGLPEPTQLLSLSQEFSQASLRGIKINLNNPHELEFLFDTNDQTKMSQEDIQRNVNYFFTGLGVEESDIWVNLSPYEANRILPQSIDDTELGRDLLLQDYLLKQISSSLTHPETGLGEAYWESKGSHWSMDGANKYWITPAKAQVYVENNAAIINNAQLAVISETEYLESNEENSHKRDILSLLNEDVNSGIRFSKLRQIYNALIMATWFKKYFFDTLYKQLINTNSLAGLDVVDSDMKSKVFELYCKSFERGVYDYVKKIKSNGVVNKKRFISGGFTLSSAVNEFEVSNTKDKPENPNGDLVKARFKLTHGQAAKSISRLIRFTVLSNLVISSLVAAKERPEPKKEKRRKPKVELEYYDTLGWKKPEISFLSTNNNHKLRMGAILAPNSDISKPNGFVAYNYSNEKKAKYWDTKTSFQVSGQLSKNLDKGFTETYEEYQEYIAEKEAEIDSLLELGWVVESDTYKDSWGKPTREVVFKFGNDQHVVEYVYELTDSMLDKMKNENYGDKWWSKKRKVDLGMGISAYRAIRLEHKIGEQFKLINSGMANFNLHSALIEGKEALRYYAPLLEFDQISSIEWQLAQKKLLRLSIGTGWEYWEGNAQSAYFLNRKFYLGQTKLKLNFITDRPLGFKTDLWFSYEKQWKMRHDFELGLGLNRNGISINNVAQYELPGKEGLSIKRFNYTTDFRMKAPDKFKRFNNAQLRAGVQYQTFAGRHNLTLTAGLNVPLSNRVRLKSNIGRQTASEYASDSKIMNDMNLVYHNDYYKFERALFFAMKDMNYSQRMDYLKNNYNTDKDKLLLALALSVQGNMNYDTTESSAFLSNAMWKEDGGANQLSAEQFLSALVDNYKTEEVIDGVVCRHISVNAARIMAELGVESYIASVLPRGGHTINLFKVGGQLYIVNNGLAVPGTVRIEKALEYYQAERGIMAGVSSLYNSDGEYIGTIKPVYSVVGQKALTVYDDKTPLEVLEDFTVNGVDEQKYKSRAREKRERRKRRDKSKNKQSTQEDNGDKQSSSIVYKLTNLIVMTCIMLLSVGCTFDENIAGPEWVDDNDSLIVDSIGKDVPFYEDSVLQEWEIGDFFEDPMPTFFKRAIVPHYEGHFDGLAALDSLDEYSYRLLEHLYGECSKDASFVSLHASLGPAAMFAQTYASISEELTTGKLNIFAIPFNMRKVYAFVLAYHEERKSSAFIDDNKLKLISVDYLTEWLLANANTENYKKVLDENFDLFDDLDMSGWYYTKIIDSFDSFEITDKIFAVDNGGTPVLWLRNPVVFQMFTGIDYSSPEGVVRFARLVDAYSKFQDFVTSQAQLSFNGFNIDFNYLLELTKGDEPSLHYKQMNSILDQAIALSQEFTWVEIILEEEKVTLIDDSYREISVRGSAMWESELSLEELLNKETGAFKKITNSNGEVINYILEPDSIFNDYSHRDLFSAFLDGAKDRTVLRKSPATGRDIKVNNDIAKGKYFELDITKLREGNKLVFNAATLNDSQMPIFVTVVYDDNSSAARSIELNPILQHSKPENAAWIKRLVIPYPGSSKEYYTVLNEYTIDIDWNKKPKYILFDARMQDNEFCLTGMSVLTDKFVAEPYTELQEGDDRPGQVLNHNLLDHMLYKGKVEINDFSLEDLDYWRSYEKDLTVSYQRRGYGVSLELFAQILSYKGSDGVSNFAQDFPLTLQSLTDLENLQSYNFDPVANRLNTLVSKYDSLGVSQRPLVILRGLKEEDLSAEYPLVLDEIFERIAKYNLKEVWFSPDVGALRLIDNTDRAIDINHSDANVLNEIDAFFGVIEISSVSLNGGADFSALGAVLEAANSGIKAELEGFATTLSHGAVGQFKVEFMDKVTIESFDIFLN